MIDCDAQRPSSFLSPPPRSPSCWIGTIACPGSAYDEELVNSDTLKSFPDFSVASVFSHSLVSSRTNAIFVCLRQIPIWIQERSATEPLAADGARLQVGNQKTTTTKQNRKEKKGTGQVSDRSAGRHSGARPRQVAHARRPAGLAAARCACTSAPPYSVFFSYFFPFSLSPACLLSVVASLLSRSFPLA